jgi:quinohemoprotein ethanol dehydrogenase
MDHVPHKWNIGVELGGIVDVMDAAGKAPPSRGALKAFDPISGETRWEVELSHFWNGGVLGTRGGLVFQGNNLGEINAFDAQTGEVLWTFNAFTAFLAPPISYQIEGRQYIAILAGTGGGSLFSGEKEGLASVNYGNAGKLLVFALGGSAQLPEPRMVDRDLPELAATGASEMELKRGEYLYFDTCAVCHGADARSAGTIPDLRRMSAETRQHFEAIVLGGLLADRGMASFADLLDAKEVALIKTYVTQRSVDDRAEIQAIQVETGAGKE